jgi:hypothetical protein
MMLRKHKVFALDRLLLESFGGKVGRGLAAELLTRDNVPPGRNPYFEPVLIVYSQDSENPSETGDNTGINKCLQ